MTSTADPLAKYQFKGPEDLTQSGLTSAVYAAPGGGKTTIGATAIDYFKRPDVIGPHVKTLILEGEGGLAPIRSRTDFAFEPITSWKQFERITDDLIQSPGLRDMYPVLMVDNFTEFSDMAMTQVAGVGGAPSYAGGEWRDHKRLVVTRIRKLRDAARLQRIAVIINLWDRAQTDDSGNVRSVTVELNPSLAKVFVGAFDLTAFLEVESDDGRRILHLGQSSRVKAKFRQDFGDPNVAAIPLDLYGPPAPAIFSLAPLMATLIGGEPFPRDQFAPPEGARPSRFDAPSPSPRPANGAPRPADRASDARHARER